MEQLFKTDRQKTPVQRSRECRAEMEKLMAEDAKWGQRTVGSQFWAQLKTEALEVARAGNAPDASEQDQAGADAALAIGELAGEKAQAAAGRKTQPGNPADPFGGTARSTPNLNRAVKLRDFAAEADHLDDGEFGGMGDFLSAIVKQVSGRGSDSRLAGCSPAYQAAGNYKSHDAFGGFLVPEQFQAQIVTSELNAAPWLDLLDSYIVPDGVGDVVTPMLSDRDTSGKDVGGVALTRIAEQSTVPLSQMVFGQRKAHLNKCGTRLRLSNELLQDNAVGVEDAIMAVFGKAVAMRRALDFFNGAGAGEPLGILNAACAATYEQAAEAEQAADTIVIENVLNMASRLNPESFSRAIWLAHPSVLPKLGTLSAVVGVGGSPLWLLDAKALPTQTLLGRPIYFAASAPLVGDKGDLSLIDPEAYRYVQRRLRIDVSRDFAFDTDEVEFRVVLRDDGAPIHATTHTGLNDWETSELVTLAAR